MYKHFFEREGVLNICRTSLEASMWSIDSLGHHFHQWNRDIKSTPKIHFRIASHPFHPDARILRCAPTGGYPSFYLQPHRVESYGVAVSNDVSDLRLTEVAVSSLSVYPLDDPTRSFNETEQTLIVELFESIGLSTNTLFSRPARETFDLLIWFVSTGETKEDLYQRIVDSSREYRHHCNPVRRLVLSERPVSFSERAFFEERGVEIGTIRK